MNNLWKVIILSGSLLLTWSTTDKWKNIVNHIYYKILSLLDSKENQEFNILESEQLNLEEIKKELNIQDKTIKNQREIIIKYIDRLIKLGIAGYESNKKKIEKSKKLIDKDNFVILNIRILLKKINNWEINQEDANKEFRKIEKVVWDSLNGSWYNFINTETETTKND